jgi:hypothetical protein
MADVTRAGTAIVPTAHGNRRGARDLVGRPGALATSGTDWKLHVEPPVSAAVSGRGAPAGRAIEPVAAGADLVR